MSAAYTHNARAFAEVSRVLRPGGKYLLKISGVRWYLLELRQALKSAKISAIQDKTPDSNPLTPSFVIVKSE